MVWQIDSLRSTRKGILAFLDDLSIEELNTIPLGFNNNIIWNVAHIIAAQQGLSYVRAGLPVKINTEFFERYKPNTKPSGYVGKDELNEIKDLLFSTLDQFEKDYNDQIFAQYNAWTSRYGVNVNNIDDLTNFLLFHDGLHFGYIVALKRAVKQSSQPDTFMPIH